MEIVGIDQIIHAKTTFYRKREGTFSIINLDLDRLKKMPAIILHIIFMDDLNRFVLPFMVIQYMGFVHGLRISSLTMFCLVEVR